MQQTMLALGALLILVTLTLNQQRSAFLLQKNAYLREMESAAADFAKKRLHEISIKDFDEARTGMDILDPGVTDLTTYADFGTDPGENVYNELTLDDIDDFHNHVDTTAHQLNNEEFQIRASYSVQYVEPDGTSTQTTAPTVAKQVTVDAVTLDSAGAARAHVRFQKVIVVSDYIDNN